MFVTILSSYYLMSFSNLMRFTYKYLFKIYKSGPLQKLKQYCYFGEDSSYDTVNY